MTVKSPIVLGVYLGHDPGACLLKQGEVVACIEEERLNRYKHGRPNDLAGLWPRFAGKFGYFPWASLCYCLTTANLAIDDLDLIMVGDALWAEAAANTIADIVPIKKKEKVVFVTAPHGAVHHYHHALSTFFASSFDTAAVLVVDGDGNTNAEGYEAETGFHFANRRGDNRVVFKNRYTENTVPRSGIGWMYEQVTLLLGFAKRELFLADPGKTMGLSAYGDDRPEFKDAWIKYQGHELRFDGFKKWIKETGYDARILSYRDGLATCSSEPSQYAKDLAFKVQRELETAMLRLAEELHRATGSEYLCLAGGVALNSVANGLIARSGPFKQIFVTPAAHDGGQAIGLAYHGHLMLTVGLPTPRIEGLDIQYDCQTNLAPEIKPMKHAYCGRVYARQEQQALLLASGLPFTELPSDEALAEAAAEDIAEGRVVAWMSGASEIGPRALGHRSILAHPGDPGMKNYLNNEVKFRESFRPFAPSVLKEYAHEVFDCVHESPYMLMVMPVRKDWLTRVPAIVHADGTARVQTVDAAVEPLFHALIRAFFRRTRIPLVLNTSLNVQGMPLVESPYDALQCLLSTRIDVLYLGNFRVQQPSLEHLIIERTTDWARDSFEQQNEIDATLLCKSRDGKHTVRLSMPLEYRHILNRLDGKSSLQTVHHAVIGASADEDSGKRLRSFINTLVRQGVLQLRVGTVVFTHDHTKTQWWHLENSRTLAGAC